MTFYYVLNILEYSFLIDTWVSAPIILYLLQDSYLAFILVFIILCTEILHFTWFRKCGLCDFSHY